MVHDKKLSLAAQGLARVNIYYNVYYVYKRCGVTYARRTFGKNATMSLATKERVTGLFSYRPK